ncbi:MULTISPECIES: DUF4089 domain-containing protein [Acetobacter]|uniref:DUF4089 domain-containing protein n=1 Tax=Acetobacter persici TaxID=1076596 RepID=A0A1U9LBL0_9PROT|nr:MULTISPECIES: DUF4089 domain-containing protein [Acetobacter]AQT03792.1 hypothetical protein A0U91_00645 [Acetobacter persici]MCG0999361.1 DUF4089 domain-containing protein [Acetobacter persici]MCP9320961.1 DUF4089 domain-containing protein [Acetobacter persici]OUI92444.1 hypothetical protein HK19_01565 [Acetobacter persici]GFE93485.1 hypothetical protein DmAi_15440 [Acetobacter persici]
MREQDKTLTRLEATAESLGLAIPDDCLPGVLANTQLLQGYVDLICGMSLPDTCLPAYEYQP